MSENYDTVKVKFLNSVFGEVFSLPVKKKGEWEAELCPQCGQPLPQKAKSEESKGPSPSERFRQSLRR